MRSSSLSGDATPSARTSARATAAGTRPAIVRRGERGPAPLSFSQQSMWFLHQWEPEAPTFNAARAVRIRGPLHVEALRQALEVVVERHESLRTIFVLHEREPRQVVLEDWQLELPVVDLSSLPARQRVVELAQTLRERSREPFDLSKDLMLRATLFTLREEESVLLVRMHHVAGDAFSVEVLFDEVSRLYEQLAAGRPAALPDLPVQYADFACWQRTRLEGDTLDGLAAYWTSALRGAPQLLPLPTDRPRRAVQRNEGSRHEVHLPAAYAAGVRELAQSQGCTVYMVLFGAFATLLYRLTGVDDVVVGTPIANRVSSELMGMIGFFSNTVALRARLGGNPTFREVCSRVRTTALGAYEHQELPFERVVELLNVPRDPAYNPIFQVNFRAQDGARGPLRLAGTETSNVPVEIGFSRFDLALELHVETDAVTGYFEFDRDLFDAATVAGFAEDFTALLDQVIAAPDTPILAVSLPHGRRRPAEAAPRTSISRTRRVTKPEGE